MSCIFSGNPKSMPLGLPFTFAGDITTEIQNKGGKREDIHICITDSCCYTAETTPIL